MHVARVYEYSMFHILCIYGLLQMDGQSVVEIMPIENEQVVNNGYYWSTIDNTFHGLPSHNILPNRGIPLETR